MPVFHDVDAWPRRPADLPSVADPRHVLLGDPGAFEVAEVQNEFMRDAQGRPQTVDRQEAMRQWQALRQAFLDAGLQCETLPAADGLADLCFTANPSFVLPLPEGGHQVWMARMAHASRRAESELHGDFFRQRGMDPMPLPEGIERFEGHGDGVLHPRRFLLHAGVGVRSEGPAWQALADAHPQLDILCYRLVDPRFYHLDTALAALDEETALFVPQAFDDSGLALLQAAFPKAIALSESEALQFAGNAFCPDGKHVFLQRGCKDLESRLRDRGFLPVPVETGEFMKSGGSVFCLKLAF